VVHGSSVRWRYKSCFYITVYSPHFRCDYYGQVDIIFEIHTKKTDWKIQALPFIAFENVGLVSCEMLMSCIDSAGYSVWLVLASLIFHQKFAF